MTVKKYMKNHKSVWGFDVSYTNGLGQNLRERQSSVKWTRKDAQKAEADFLNNIPTKSGQISYLALFNAYTAFKSPTLKASTLKVYRDHHEQRILPYFGKKQIRDITPQAITEWQSVLLNSQYKGKPYSNAIIKGTQTCFMMVLNWGVARGYIESNPFKVPYVQRKEVKAEMQVYDDDTFNKFFSVIDEPTYKAFFHLLYNSGMRKGEAIALNIEDYDGKGVTISKTWDKDIHRTTPPKTLNSYRYVLLPKSTCELIDDLIASYPKVEGYRTLPLFGYPDRLGVTTMERKKKEWMDMAEVPYLPTHGFRHSHVTDLIQNARFTSKMVAKRIGDTEETVLRTYSHLYANQQEQILEYLDKKVVPK